MPEIPELEAIRGFFNEHLSGSVIATVETRIPPVFRTPAKELRDTLPGGRSFEVLDLGRTPQDDTAAVIVPEDLGDKIRSLEEFSLELRG